MSMADSGNKCIVVAPQSITKNIVRKKSKRPYMFFDKCKNGNEIKVFQPKYISFSNLKFFNTNLSIFFRNRAILECLKKEKINPDLYYAHFWDCGVVACVAAKSTNKPVYVATGESRIRIFDYHKKSYIYRNLKRVSGVICVSTKNFDESKKLGLATDKTKTVVLPNAINTEDFHPIPKELAREELGFNLNDKIAIFVGAFSERKGVLRVVKAVERIPDLKLVLIGAGEQDPQSDRIIFKGRVAHNEIYKYLNAADVFVLPTLAEGCCNAIVEALACGVPVVSSNLPFNWDILDETNSIMIDPNNIIEMSEAVGRIVSDEDMYRKISDAALNKAKTLTIESRGQAILDFLRK